MIRTLARLCLSVSLIIPLSLAAQSEPEKLGSHRYWDAYVFDGEEGKICYIASGPLESTPAIEDRGETWVLVTHRPSATVENEVGVIAGFNYQEGTPVNVIIDTEKYELFTKADGAWLRTAEEEAEIVAAMKGGQRMTVVGYSRDGVTTTDKYSLLGFTAAHRAISKACGVN